MIGSGWMEKEEKLIGHQFRNFNYRSRGSEWPWHGWRQSVVAVQNAKRLEVA